MKYKLFLTILLSLLVLPAYSQLSSTDLDKIKLIVNDAIKKEISEYEARIKEYVNIKFETVEKRFEGVEKRFDTIEGRFDIVDKQIGGLDKRVTHSSNVNYGLIALIVVAVGIPQIISVIQSIKNRELERKLDMLTRKIETLEQQRIVNP